MNVLYIYGYGSHAKENRTAGNLRKYLPEDYQVLCYDYPQEDCSLAREEIKRLIREHDIRLLIGSSLGAFLALTIPGIPKLVMNPCWSPSKELPLIGCPSHMAESYQPFESLLTDCDMDEEFLTLGFFSRDDELLGTRYVQPFTQNYGAPLMMEGGHRVTEEAIRDTVAPHLPDLWEKVGRLSKFLLSQDNLPIYDDLLQSE